jgi:plastocyanin
MNNALKKGMVLATTLLVPVVAQGYDAGGVANGGKVAGKVLFKGAVPAPRKIPITKDTNVCGTGEREVVEVAVSGEALKNAVVYVAKIDRGKAWGDVEKQLLNQQGCRFTPDVLLVKKGGDITIRNSDPVLHNIHTYEIIGAVRRTMFNVGQPDKGDMHQTASVRRANVIKIECDAHDFMHAWAFAAENPYAAVTKEDGSFSIENLPPGDYEVKAWHPILGEKSAKVTVKSGATAGASFEFSK